MLVFVAGIVLGASIREAFVQEPDAPGYQNTNTEEVKKEQKLIKSDDKHLDEIEILNAKISELEKELSAAQKDLSENSMTINFKKPDKIKPLTVSALVDAGIEEFLAQEIIRRKDEREYKYLELRDRAVREGYINTPLFRKELRQLKYDDSMMKNELGDDVYDRYLYAMGKHNRVSVLSIMQGSPAEHAGIMIGDTIVSYDGERVFSWQELNKATLKGQRDESVIVNVQRNGGLFNILVPRGPLGVKLEAGRVLP